MVTVSGGKIIVNYQECIEALSEGALLPDSLGHVTLGVFPYLANAPVSSGFCR